jgi:hypothetical protein
MDIANISLDKLGVKRLISKGIFSGSFVLQERQKKEIPGGSLVG